MRQVRSTRDSTFVRLDGKEDMAETLRRLTAPQVLEGTIRLAGTKEYPVSRLILLIDQLIKAGAKRVQYKSAAVRGHGWELARVPSMGLFGH